MSNIIHINRNTGDIALEEIAASSLLAVDADQVISPVVLGDSLELSTLTLDTVQDIRTTATPTFVGVELDNSAELRFESSLLVGGIALTSYRDDVAYGSVYNNYFRARGDSLAEIATVEDGDWATKWRMYGWTGSAYTQFGGFLYDMYDVSEGYGKFVFYGYSDGADYIFEAGTEYTRIGDTDGTDYVNISSTNGDLSFAGSAGFYPRVLNQAEEPAAGTGATQCDTGEAVIWTDTDDSKCYLCYNHGGTVKTVEMT